MAKRKHRVVRAEPVARSATLMPLTALLLMFTGVFVGYFGARIVTPEDAHPIHWGITALVALLGYLIGMLWYHVRGDMTL